LYLRLADRRVRNTLRAITENDDAHVLAHARRLLPRDSLDRSAAKDSHQ
jgi:hypothetical protein